MMNISHTRVSKTDMDEKSQPEIKHQVKGQQTRSLQRPFLPAQERAVNDALDALTGALATLLQENLAARGLVTGMDFAIGRNEADEPVIKVRLMRAILVPSSNRATEWSALCGTI